MRLDFLNRLQKELSVTSTALHEAVVSIAERVNRKVQILRLHWQASSVLERIDAISQDLGHQIVDQISRRPSERRPLDPDLSEVDNTIHRAATRIQTLKQSLIELDVQIRQLKVCGTNYVHSLELKLFTASLPLKKQVHFSCHRGDLTTELLPQ